MWVHVNAHVDLRTMSTEGRTYAFRDSRVRVFEIDVGIGFSNCVLTSIEGVRHSGLRARICHSSLV